MSFIKYSIGIFVFIVCPIAVAEQNQEELTTDFLEFLADMDEVTGSGFNNWLEDESEESSEYETEDEIENNSGTENHE